MLGDIEVIDTLSTASDGTELVKTESGGFAVREYREDPDSDSGFTYRETEYDLEKDAILHFALWVSANGFKRPHRSNLAFIPTSIVTQGQAAIAAWLYLQGGNGPTSRSVAADYLDVSEHTISRYLSRVRDEVAP